MRTISWLGWTVAVGAAGSLAWACGGSTKAQPTADASAEAAMSVEASAPECAPCKGAGDCPGATCATFPAGMFCAPACQTDAQCASDMTCAPSDGASGARVCVPRGGVCGGAKDAGSGDGGTDAAPNPYCGMLAGPTQSSSCVCPTGRTCQPNGCRNGDYCDPSTNTCGPAPIGCGTPGTSYDAGGTVTGSIAVDGGTVSRLYFGVVGDTRPANEDDTPGYPTAVITKIFQDIQALSPLPSFLVTTGDYQFAAPTGTQSQPQLSLYLGARAIYTGPVFPAMGNHECTGYTASNCGIDASDGITPNFTNYVQMFLGPIGQPLPHYEIDMAASDASWTAKFIFVAANAWDQAQADWLDMAMTRPTTYTILVRHEPLSSSTAPGVAPAQNIMLNHPYTLSLVGHDHTYTHVAGTREVTIGNGGAPLGGPQNYGFGMVSQQSDGSLAIDAIDYATGLADATFHFTVTPDGKVSQ